KDKSLDSRNILEDMNTDSYKNLGLEICLDMDNKNLPKRIRQKEYQ
ncbi:9395_t:CDS:1, partial [Racocetra persica]